MWTIQHPRQGYALQALFLPDNSDVVFVSSKGYVAQFYRTTHKHTFIGLQEDVTSLIVDSYSQYLYAGGDDDKVVKWAIATGEEQWHASVSNAVSCLYLCDESDMVAVGLHRGGIVLLNDNTGFVQKSVRDVPLKRISSIVRVPRWSLLIQP